MKPGIKREFPEQYVASSKRIDVVDVPKFNFIMIDGIGNPNVPEFKLKSKALRLLSKHVRTYYREKDQYDYLLSPLEGIWDTYDNEQFDVERKKFIKFTLMIVVPDRLTSEVFDHLKEEIIAKHDNPYLIDIYLKSWEEGLSVQMLHRGSYSTEIDTTKQIMEYITVQGFKLSGLHHEVYLNDPDKVAEDKLKTIIRYAVERV